MEKARVATAVRFSEVAQPRGRHRAIVVAPSGGVAAATASFVFCGTVWQTFIAPDIAVFISRGRHDAGED